MNNIKENNGVLLQGHIKIHDPDSGHVFVNKRNAIHYENMSLALAESLANAGQGFVNSMVFGNGGTSIDPKGIKFLERTNIQNRYDDYKKAFIFWINNKILKILRLMTLK